jgi:trk system potassium uptake protein TrkH
MAFKKTTALSSLQIWNSTILKVSGGIILMMGLVFLLPSLYAYFVSEDPSIFLYPVPFMIIIGLALFLLNAPSKDFSTVNGIFLVIVVWLVLFFIGSIPYILAGMSPLNSIFESVSGFTTTGSSTIEDVHAMPESLMVWRSLTQWIGGIAVVLIFIYILPMFGMGRTFFSNELEGSGSSQLSMRLKNAASSFIQVYVGLTVINLLLLLLCNASVCDAICLSFTTISTGGLLVSNTSLMEMNIWIQIVTIVFMFIGGTNFYLHFKAIYGRNLKVYTTSKEFRNILLWFFVVSVVIFIAVDWQMIASLNFDIGVLATDYKNALYTVVSLGTTTGSAVFDYTQYPVGIMLLLIVVMLIGASAGSTSGGIKFTRMRVVLRFFNNTIKNVLHPNAIYSVSHSSR